MWTQLGMDRGAKILLPDSNGTHWVSKSSNRVEIWLKIFLSKLFQFGSLLPRCLGQSMSISLSLSQGWGRSSEHSADGFPRARGSVIAQRNSPTGALHPRSSLVERRWILPSLSWQDLGSGPLEPLGPLFWYQGPEEHWCPCCSVSQFFLRRDEDFDTLSAVRASQGSRWWAFFWE